VNGIAIPCTPVYLGNGADNYTHSCVAGRRATLTNGMKAAMLGDDLTPWPSKGDNHMTQ
jgi:hypothetical protein